MASAKIDFVHQTQNIHLYCALNSVIWLWNMNNAQCRQWQDTVFSHAGTASYCCYKTVWQTIQRSSQWQNKTTSLLLMTDVTHYLITSVTYCRTHLLNNQCNCEYKPTTALLTLLTASDRRVVYRKIGCGNWNKTRAYLMMLPGYCQR